MTPSLETLKKALAANHQDTRMSYYRDEILWVISRLESAEAELAALKESTRWIPVGERLPEKFGAYEVLSAVHGPPISSQVCHYSRSNGWGLPKTLYWREIQPLPPLEESK